MIIPELFGEDEQVVGQANALFQGAIRTTMLLGPPIGGVLIGVMGASSVLVVDAATYLVSFALVALFVPGTPPVPAAPESRGLLTGLRVLFRDPLLRVWLPLFLAGDAAWLAFFAAVPVLVVQSYDADPTVAGILFAAFGAGSVCGNFLSFRFLLPALLGPAPRRVVGTDPGDPALGAAVARSRLDARARARSRAASGTGSQIRRSTRSSRCASRPRFARRG